MFDLKSSSANPLRALIAIALLGFQVWYLLSVGFTDLIDPRSNRDESVVRGVLLFAIVQGAAHLLIARVAPRNLAGLLTKISVLPLASIVAIGAGLTFLFPGWILMINQITRHGDWSLALGYAAAAAYLAAAWKAIEIAEQRA